MLNISECNFKYDMLIHSDLIEDISNGKENPHIASLPCENISVYCYFRIKHC